MSEEEKQELKAAGVKRKASEMGNDKSNGSNPEKQNPSIQEVD